MPNKPTTQLKHCKMCGDNSGIYDLCGVCMVVYDQAVASAVKVIRHDAADQIRAIKRGTGMTYNPRHDSFSRRMEHAFSMLRYNRPD